jgi:hypothetical protein
VDFQWKKRGPQLLFRAPPIRGRIRLHHAEVIALAILAAARNRHLGSTVLPPADCTDWDPASSVATPIVLTVPAPGWGRRSIPSSMARLSLSGSIEQIIMRALPFIKPPTEGLCLQSSGTVENCTRESRNDRSGHNAPFRKMSIYDEAWASQVTPLYRCVAKEATPKMLLPESIISKE